MAEEKYYIINAISEEAFDILHEYLTTSTSIEGVPNREVICENYTLQSPTRGTYLLTDEEKAQVEQRPEVEYINLDVARYPEMQIPSDQLRCDIIPPQVDRYNPNDLPNANVAGTVRNYMQYAFSVPSTPGVTELNRTTSQLHRMTQKLTPWSSNNTVLNEMPQHRGTGKDVDVIVGDNGSWIGHPEFMMEVTNAVYPQDFVAGNVLSRRDGRDTDNATAPLCNVLDLVLDSPYYIDPDWFNADPGNRLETRWDGTVVPVESVARAWWASGANRSAQFASAGTVFVTTNYTRNRAHGSNTVAPGDGTHGTQCAGLTFGRTQGWAYNANKWVVDAYGSSFLGFEQYFDIMKIFHVNKPVNSTWGTQDPTISSNSWGFRVTPRSSGYYNHRGTDISYTSSTSNAPAIMRVVTTNGDGRMKHYPKPNSLLTAGNEMVDAGVIFVGAAGNDSQQQVLPDHPNWNNFHNDVAGETIDDTNWVELGAYFNAYASTNRPGFPQCIGPTDDNRFKVINIGALDDDFLSGAENKAYYSDCGPAVDCYAPADGTLAAASPNDTTSIVNRYDNTYSGMTADGGTAEDTYFNGTSAACPVACGFLATVLEHNRSWIWSDLKNYIKNTIEPQDASAFAGQNSDWASATDSGWLTTTNLAGADPIILYEAAYTISNASNVAVPKRIIRGPINLRGSINIRFRNE